MSAAQGTLAVPAAALVVWAVLAAAVWAQWRRGRLHHGDVLLVAVGMVACAAAATTARAFPGGPWWMVSAVLTPVVGVSVGLAVGRALLWARRAGA